MAAPSEKATKNFTTVESRTELVMDTKIMIPPLYISFYRDLSHCDLKLVS